MMKKLKSRIPISKRPPKIIRTKKDYYRPNEKKEIRKILRGNNE
jgi:hypothetical protein